MNRSIVTSSNCARLSRNECGASKSNLLKKCRSIVAPERPSFDPQVVPFESTSDTLKGGSNR
jgi:hypothetical protein